MRKKTANPDFWLPARWPAPANIHAGTTTRAGGTSPGAYATLNLAGHVNDDPRHVTHNRELLVTELDLPREPAWLRQVHGNKVVNIATDAVTTPADGAYANETGYVCAILTADCLPLLLCAASGREIAAVHIGWRGFSKNIIAAALGRFTTPPDQLMAWIGPYIHAKHYEVGMEVRIACLDAAPGADLAFGASRTGHWYADLGRLVRYQLEQQGVNYIHGGEYCTCEDAERFYSYRRDSVTGRTASLIWMA